MAIIDELRKEEVVRKATEEKLWYSRMDSMIEGLVSRLAGDVRYGIQAKKDISYKDTICYAQDLPKTYYSIGVPRNAADRDDWHWWTIHDEDMTQYAVEKLKAMIEKEFRPQRLNVRYNSHKKGVFKVQKYYTVSVDVLIKCK